MLIIESR